MFQHEFVNLPSITSQDTSSGRFYTTPDGNSYQSVTTFLSRFSEDNWLEEWIERVGEDQASRVSTQAKRRGTAVHSIVEQICLNNPKYSFRQMPNNLIMAESIADILRARVCIIKGIEVGLWSDSMKIAGRSDMFGVFDGVNSIIDFKTSKYKKKSDDIYSYYLQCTLYALMVEELLSIEVPQIVVIIGVDHEPAQVFVKDKSQYVERIREMVLGNNVSGAVK